MQDGQRSAATGASTMDAALSLFAADIPVAVAMFDRDMRYLAWSREWARHFGIEGTDLAGRNQYDVLPNLPEHWRQAHERGLSGEEIDRDEDGWRGTDGRQMWMRWRIRPVRAQGAVSAIVVFVEDITAQHAAQVELRRSADRLQLITNALGIGLFDHDIATGRSTLSDSYLDLLDITSDQVPQSLEGWTALLRPVDPKTYHAAQLKALDPASGGSFSCHIRPLVRGVERDMEVKARVLFRDDGATRVPDRIIGLIIDQTESRHLQEELSRALRLETVGRLAGMVAHDFNNVLTVILANLELAGLRTLEPDLKPLLRNATDAAEMGATFNKRLLALAGGHRTESRPIVLDEHLAQVWDVFQRVLSDGVTLRFLPGAPGATVSADSAEIDGALLNLVINARDAQPGGGRIEVRTDIVELDSRTAATIKGGKSGRFLRLSVRDSGPGISPGLISRLGEPFLTTKGPGQGNGLGLTSVIMSAERAGGFLRIDSAPGAGTVMAIHLPVVEGRAQVHEPDDRDFPFGNGELVLVVEDDPLVREAALLRLEALGYAVIEAGNADAALRQIEGGEPVDLVFSDVVMPGEISGYDLVSKLQARHPGIATLLTSGHVSAALRGRDKLRTPVPLLAKPYSLKTLARAVAAALNQVRTKD